MSKYVDESAEKDYYSARMFAKINGFFTTVLLAVLGTLLFLYWVVYRFVVRPAWLGMLPEDTQLTFDLLEAAATFALVVLWIAIGWFWLERRHKNKAVKNRSDLYKLSPTAFEHYVADLFRQRGYTVHVRGKSGDLGVDLELISDTGRRAIVQCKRYQRTVGPDIVRELYGTLIHERVARAFLVTTADISASAREWARGKPMTLIDGKTLAEIAQAVNDGR